MVRITAQVKDKPIDMHKGHYGTSNMYTDGEKMSLGHTKGMLQGNWRGLHNTKPVKVVNTTVDTIACL